MKQKLTLWLLLMGLSPVLRAQNGLLGSYYNGSNFEALKMTRKDKSLDFYWDRGVAPADGIDPSNFSVRWKGQLKAPKTGKYLFSAKVDDGLRVRVGGRLVINAWSLNDHMDFKGSIELKAGELYPLEVEYFNGLLEGELRLFWQLPGEEPVFGGLFGYNEKKIEGQYLFLPPEEETKKTKPVALINIPPRSAPPTAPKQAPKPTRQTQVQPRQQSVSAIIANKDTLERYIPKNINFEKSTAVMLTSSYAELDRLSQFLLRNKTVKISIEGHTDNVGDSRQNLILSENRAKTVADYLSKKGIDNSRLSTKGYGDTRPLEKEKVKGGNPVNRRVEFILSL